MEGAPPAAGQQNQSAAEAAQEKTKRLLSLARSKLEENQATLAAKDAQIAQLRAALEAEAQSRRNRNGLGQEEKVPRNLLRRVDVEDLIWILVEYEGGIEDDWISFRSEEDLKDWVQRIPGAPLTIPPRCLTGAESLRIEAESKKRVERIVEEFRRFKVRAEIARKQKDVEARQATLRGATSTLAQTVSASGGGGGQLQLSSTLEKALSDGALGQEGDGNNSQTDELARIKTQLGDQDAKWRQAYEKVVKENELLKTRGSEAILAAQWRERYEACQRDKDDLAEKLKIYSNMMSSGKGVDGSGGGGGGISGTGKPLEQMYIELRDEYKEFRRRVIAAEQQRRNEMNQQEADGDGCSSHNMYKNGTRETHYSSGGLNRADGRDSSDYAMMGMRGQGGGGGGGGMRTIGMGESKIQYIRHMILQYFSCRDAEVKQHIEAALKAIFRFNEAERAAIALREKEESTDAISSITNFLSSLT